MAHRLSCPEASEIFLNQRLNPFVLHWQADRYLYHCATWEALKFIWKRKKSKVILKNIPGRPSLPDIMTVIVIKTVRGWCKNR